MVSKEHQEIYDVYSTMWIKRDKVRKELEELNIIIKCLQEKLDTFKGD